VRQRRENLDLAGLTLGEVSLAEASLSAQAPDCLLDYATSNLGNIKCERRPDLAQTVGDAQGRVQTKHQGDDGRLDLAQLEPVVQERPDWCHGVTVGLLLIQRA
jgi:hypothetical protein